MHYYNEWDAFCAQWLRNLIDAKLIPPGDVDSRDIRLVQPDDLKAYTQCHFFAGIAGWPLALAIAGWPDDRPVWTGSCPCQPFSAAGKRRGTKDDRHLWPDLYRLISAVRPPVVFGEQVASKDGRTWCTGVQTDLEGDAYEFAAVDLCAASVGAPHIRQRLFWVADAQRNTGRTRRTADKRGRSNASEGTGSSVEPGRRSSTRGLANTDSERLNQEHALLREEEAGRIASHLFETPWSGAIDVTCRDGFSRRVPAEPSFQPLADGLPGRLGQLRAYGNAIVPQVAAEVIAAFMDARP